MKGTLSWARTFIAVGLLVTVALSGGCADAPNSEAPSPSQAPATGDATPAEVPPSGRAEQPELDETPVVVFETVKGKIEIELFAADAPKSAARLVSLVRSNFYRGQRFHRVEPGILVQIGDPNSRDFTKRDRWGQGGSGQQIGVAEITPDRRHVRGAVGLAHAGQPERADSQFYIMQAARPSLDGKYTVIGRVIAGMDVVDQLEVGDMVRRVSVKAEDPRP